MASNGRGLVTSNATHHDGCSCFAIELPSLALVEVVQAAGGRCWQAQSAGARSK